MATPPHSPDPLRLAAFWAYVAAWVAFAIGAAVNAIPAIRASGTATANPATGIGARPIAGTVLQIAGFMTITFFLGDGPLRPSRLELAGALFLAPVAAALFLWTTRTGKSAGGLVTCGAYRRLRHPMYLSFLAMLVATGLLASDGLRLGLGVVLYLAGTEVRIAAEETELRRRFGVAHEQYCLRTRWRFLPGLR